jgi:phage-related baseplate assembly protein
LSNIPELSRVPDVSFIDEVSLESVRDQWISDVCEKYKEITGEQLTLPPADPIRLVGYATALLGYQCLQYIDRAGKVDLLKYSYGNFLDNIAALKGIFRRGATGAITTLRFTASAVRASVTGIPAKSKVTDEKGNRFATDEYAEIPAGQLYVDVQATAVEPGKGANGLPAGTITNFVNTIPYIQSVTNTVPTSGGDDVEDDDNLTYRVLMAPAGYSVAGPKEAYEYWARQFRTDIDDVKVYTPSPTEVTVLFMLNNGVAPDGTIIASMQEFLAADPIRPLTDKVIVAAPSDVEYEINLTYYINRSDSVNATTIQSAVIKAIAEYKAWQRKIGKDINPDELIRRIKNAGAKRVELTAPTFVKVADTDIALSGNEAIRYGGLEDD